MPDLTQYRIIHIHGLASKPPPEDLHRLWCNTLIANIANDSPELATAMKSSADLFRSAYWANTVPDHLEDTPAYVKNLISAIDALTALRKKSGDSLHISKAGWALSQVKKFGLNIVDTLATALTIKDDVIDEHLEEIHLYKEDQYIADRMRAPLEHELCEAWDNKKKIIIISHSMGTLIAYDVLWRFSHRSEPEYKKYRKQIIDLLITMGSPLGDPGLRKFMLIDRWKDTGTAKSKAERQRYYPTNLKRWHNYSAYGDIVCHDGTLDDDFFTGLRKDVGGYDDDDLRDYVKLYNPFITPEGKPNPHKSYGYLIQPKLSQKLIEYFNQKA